MRGSSDNGCNYQNRNKQSDLQRLLLSDASGDEDVDGSISLGVSESESFQDSDSSWDLEKNKQRNSKRRNTKRGKYTSRTANDLSIQRNRDATKSKGAERTPQSDASGNEGLDDSVLYGIFGIERIQESDSTSDSDMNWQRDSDVSVLRNLDERNIKCDERTAQSDESTGEGLGDSTSLEVSDSECLQDSDSSWDLDKIKKQERKKRNKKRKVGYTD